MNDSHEQLSQLLTPILQRVCADVARQLPDSMSFRLFCFDGHNVVFAGNANRDDAITALCCYIAEKVPDTDPEVVRQWRDAFEGKA